jgi:hypothetical protein
LLLHEPNQKDENFAEQGKNNSFDLLTLALVRGAFAAGKWPADDRRVTLSILFPVDISGVPLLSKK